MFGELSPAEIEEVLKIQLVGRLGLHADGITYVVPISYAYDGENIYGHTLEGMKIEMMRKNAAVCFETDHLENMGNWKSVICWGEFEELNDEDEKREAIEKLMSRPLPLLVSDTVKITSTWPFSPNQGEDVEGILYRIRLTKKTGRYEQKAEKR